MTDTPAPAAPPSPDEEPSAEEVAAAGRIRPLEDLPSPWQVSGHPKMIEEPTLAALSPEDRKTVIERAAGSNDPDALNAALHGFLRERSAAFRLMAGAGDGASATEREALEQMNTLRVLGDELSRLEDQLAEVTEHRTEIDEHGNAVAVPVYLLQGAARAGRQTRIDEIKHEMSLIAGIQGEAALKRAARADAIRTRELQSAAYEREQIETRARDLVREDRINEAARTKAKFLKGSVG